MSETTESSFSLSKGPLIAFIFLALMWGYNWVVMKIAMQYCPSMYFALIRAGGGGVVLLLAVLISGGPIKIRFPGRVLLLGLLQTSGFVGLISWAVAHGEAGKNAVFAYSMPFWVILLSGPFLGEYIRGRQWLAVLLAFAGLILIISPWNTGGHLLDNMLGIASGLSWGASVIVFRKIPISGMKELLSVTGWQMIFGLPLIIIAAFILPQAAIQWNGVLVLAILFNIIAATAVAWILWYYLLQRLPANVSSFSVLIVPVIGVVASWIQLNEQPTPIAGIGMILMVIALGIKAWAG